jgi:hyperosmotically inducible periplasmic protein
MRKSSSRFMQRIILAIFSLVLSFGLLGTVASANTKQQAPPSDTPAYQTWLANQVRHKLVMLPFYSVFDNLEYQIQGNTVTLKGQVVLPVLKGDAAAAVKHIEGVEAVNNQIEVLPTSPNDDRIRRSVFRAIYRQPGLDMYAFRSVPTIHIIVKNGNVTLEGAVARQADKTQAGMIANTVPFVFSVTNNLQVEKS